MDVLVLAWDNVCFFPGLSRQLRTIAMRLTGDTRLVIDLLLSMRTDSHVMFQIAAAQETFGTVNDGVVGWVAYNASHPNTGGSISEATRNMARSISMAVDQYVDYSVFDRNGRILP